jgi:hypothetical protein
MCAQLDLEVSRKRPTKSKDCLIFVNEVDNDHSNCWGASHGKFPQQASQVLVVAHMHV